MDPLAALIDKAEAVAVIDAYQYLNRAQRQADLPYNLRILMRRRPASQLGSAVHDQFCLVVALRTQGLVQLEKRTLHLRPGEALLVFPGQLHGYADVVEADVFWLFFSFHRDQAAELDGLRGCVVTLDQRILDDIGVVIDQHFHHSERGKRHTPGSERQAALRLDLVLEQLLVRRLETISETAGADATTGVDTSHPLVRQIIAYITEHLDQPIAIADIGRALHRSPGHLRNEFHRYAGFGLGRFVRYLKMAHACRLMDTTQMGLAEISQRCGYSSIYSFSRAFKTEKGIPPSAYREAWRSVR